MQVKVFYGDITKVVDTTRTSTYNQLLDEVIKAFELKDKRENIRLRSYNVPNKTMQETYTGKESIILTELRIYPQKSLVLEVKKDDEVFIEFDPNQIQIKINTWHSDIIVLDEEALKPTKIFVKKNGTISELIDSLVGTTQIPKEFISYLYLITAKSRKETTYG